MLWHYVCSWFWPRLCSHMLNYGYFYLVVVQIISVQKKPVLWLYCLLLLLLLLNHFSCVRLVWPHRWQPTRLPYPWNSPGKNTGVGWHFLLHCMKVKSEGEVTQSCLTPSNPMDWAYQAPRPWDSPGKNTGVGWHFLLQCMKVKSESEVAQSCPTLSDPMDYSLPGSSVHGILQARVLEWGTIAFSMSPYWGHNSLAYASLPSLISIQYLLWSAHESHLVFLLFSLTQ